MFLPVLLLTFPGAIMSGLTLRALFGRRFVANFASMFVHLEDGAEFLLDFLMDDLIFGQDDKHKTIIIEGYRINLAGSRGVRYDVKLDFSRTDKTSVFRVVEAMENTILIDINA
jgi:hypothetical protein